jgi:23S rRNA pseudouridine1911/1915/1917 synthase
MSAAPLLILHHDDCLLAVNKPQGLLTQAPAQIESLEQRVREYLAADDKRSGGEYLGVPHRLDRATTGAIVFALTPRAARQLARQFERRLVEKRYWAIVSGRVEPSEGTWRDWLRKVPNEPRGELVPPDHADAREAILNYRVLEHSERGTWLEVTPLTGRMHQIRVQAAARGNSVLGDKLYGNRERFGPATAEERERGMALHARSLSIIHPTTRERVTFVAALHNWWRDEPGFAWEQH